MRGDRDCGFSVAVENALDLERAERTIENAHVVNPAFDGHNAIRRPATDEELFRRQDSFNIFRTVRQGARHDSLHFLVRRTHTPLAHPVAAAIDAHTAVASAPRDNPVLPNVCRAPFRPQCGFHDPSANVVALAPNLALAVDRERKPALSCNRPLFQCENRLRTLGGERVAFEPETHRTAPPVDIALRRIGENAFRICGQMHRLSLVSGAEFKSAFRNGLCVSA